MYIDENPMLRWPYCSPRPDNMGIKNSEYDQKIPQSQTADKPMASWGRATQQPQDTRKTSKATSSLFPIQADYMTIQEIPDIPSVALYAIKSKNAL